MSNEHDSLALSVQYEPDIHLALNRYGGLDVDTVNDLALGPCLVGYKCLAEQFCCRIADLILTAAEFDTPSLASSSRVNLSLDGEPSTADLGGAIHRLLGGVRDSPRRNGHAEIGQQFLCLVLMNIHLTPSFSLLIEAGQALAEMAAAISTMF